MKTKKDKTESEITESELQEWLKENPIYLSCVCDKCKGTGIIETIAPFPTNLKKQKDK